MHTRWPCWNSGLELGTRIPRWWREGSRGRRLRGHSQRLHDAEHVAASTNLARTLSHRRRKLHVSWAREPHANYATQSWLIGWFEASAIQHQSGRCGGMVTASPLGPRPLGLRFSKHKWQQVAAAVSRTQDRSSTKPLAYLHWSKLAVCWLLEVVCNFPHPVLHPCKWKGETFPASIRLLYSAIIIQLFRAGDAPVPVPLT